jgi:hypothetical protein
MQGIEQIELDAVKQLNRNLTDIIHRRTLPSQVIHGFPTYWQLIQNLLEGLFAKCE